MQRAIWWFGCTGFSAFVSSGQLAGKKGPDSPNHGQGHFESN